tara:strand:+ start:13968 stop:15377 length:1410 start_codon:yes stop_codon:yes gene_type:complete
MSVDLNEYFNLGLDSTNNPIEEAGQINVFRTPVDTSSQNLNRITFKVPKSGLLTADSMLNLQFVLQDTTATDSQFTLNLINGAIGAIKRTRILLDNKVLVDLQKPGLPEIVKLYSRNTQIELAEREYKLMGNQFRSSVDPAGEEILKTSETRYYTNQLGVNSLDRNIILQPESSKVYGIPIKHLGADFLEAASLPVFLLGEREMIIEIEFFKDCREYVCTPDKSGGSTVLANTAKVVVENCELVTTHIILPSEVEQNEIAAMKNSPVQYPLLDTYLIKGSVNTQPGALGASNNASYRINFQNREVHNLLMCPVDVVPGSDSILANQRSNSLGKEQLQMKINGQNLFDRPITNQANIYQLTTYSENGRALKLPIGACRVDPLTLANMDQSTQDFYLDYRGGCHYLKVDFSNGNNGVFGSGTLMRQAAVIEQTYVSATTTNPNQKATRDMNFYPTISKLLSIGANKISISF